QEAILPEAICRPAPLTLDLRANVGACARPVVELPRHRARGLEQRPILLAADFELRGTLENFPVRLRALALQLCGLARVIAEQPGPSNATQVENGGFQDQPGILLKIAMQHLRADVGESGMEILRKGGTGADEHQQTPIPVKREKGQSGAHIQLDVVIRARPKSEPVGECQARSQAETRQRPSRYQRTRVQRRPALSK